MRLRPGARAGSARVPCDAGWAFGISARRSGWPIACGDWRGGSGGGAVGRPNADAFGHGWSFGYGLLRDLGVEIEELAEI